MEALEAYQAKWHKSCYLKFNDSKLERARKREWKCTELCSYRYEYIIRVFYKIFINISQALFISNFRYLLSSHSTIVVIELKDKILKCATNFIIAVYTHAVHYHCCYILNLSLCTKHTSTFSTTLFT